MIPSKFEYIKANSVSEAISLLNKHDDAKLLAGGHSLIPAMKLRMNQPEVLVDIGGIAELKEISVSGGSVQVGANCTHAQIAAHMDVQKHAPALAAAAAAIGDIQVRNAGTIGGSLAHADPASDYPAVIMAHDATVVVEGENGAREISASDLYEGLYETSIAEDEVITAVKFPQAEGGVYVKFPNPASRYAVVGCAAVKVGGNLQVGLTGVAENAYRASAVEGAIDSGPEAASDHAIDGVEVLGDHFASSEYRGHLAKVFVRKALEAV